MLEESRSSLTGDFLRLHGEIVEEQNYAFHVERSKICFQHTHD